MKTLKEIFDILEESNIQIYNYEEKEKLCGYELNTYTDGGVNQIIFLDFRDNGNPTSEKDFIAKFSERVNDIDIDEEIEINRQDKLYKANFTIRQSLEDFENWKKNLEKIVNLINK